MADRGGRAPPVREGRALVERLDKGETLEALAGEPAFRARTATDLGRNAPGDLAPDLVARIFAVPAGSASAPSGEDARAVFKVTAATVPPLVAATQEAAAVDERLQSGAGRRPARPVRRPGREGPGVFIYRENLRRAVGGES